MKKYNFLLLFILLLNNAYSQTYQFKGKVIDATSKKTLPFVAISIEGDTRGIQTDIDGKFILNYDKEDFSGQQVYNDYKEYCEKS